MRDSIEKRFWSKVDIKGLDDCWEWASSKFSDGCGKFRLGNKAVKSHTFAYTSRYKSIPPDKEVLHRCNNLSCVNPRHLYLNSIGGIKPTQPGGKPSSLGLDDIETIKRLRSSGFKLREISKIFSLSIKYLSMIDKGERGQNCIKNSPFNF